MKYRVLLITCGAILALSGCVEGRTSAQDVSLPDLVIEDVQVNAGKEPGENFPYYEYWATVRIKNLGSMLRSGNIYLSAGDDQTNVRLKNQDEEFVLLPNEVVEVPYQILKANTDPRQFTFQIDSGDDEFSKLNGGKVSESDEKNNSYSLQVL